MSAQEKSAKLVDLIFAYANNYIDLLLGENKLPCEKL